MGKIFRLNKLIIWGCLILMLIVLATVLVPLISPYSYDEINGAIKNLPTSWNHWFGTDKFGRDIFTRVWTGAGISLVIGFGSVAINGFIGIVYGSIAGYRGGRFDTLLMRTADVIASVPSMIYIILFSLVSGASIMGILAGICVSGWIETARIVRGEVMRVRDRDYIWAAHLSGVPAKVILGRYILPVIAGPAIISMTYIMPQAMFAESFLSFAGIGLSPPVSSLGTMIRDALSLVQVYPMHLVYPVVVLCLIIISVSLTGTGLEQMIRKQREGIGLNEIA